MINLVKRFVQDESGATAVEYGLVAAGISVAIIAVMQGLGSKLARTLRRLQTPFQLAQARPPRHCHALPRNASADLTARLPANANRTATSPELRSRHRRRLLRRPHATRDP